MPRNSGAILVQDKLDLAEVTAAGSAKILDFGLAKLMTESNPDATQTADGIILGTPAYMAPEQAEGKPLDARSDIFSFGSVLYEMLCGNRAFPGASTAQALTAVLRDEPAPLAVSAEFQRIICKCLAKRPEDRFVNMAELRRALEQAASPSGAASKDGSEPAVGEEGFWIAVIPFKWSGAGAELRPWRKASLKILWPDFRGSPISACSPRNRLA